METDMPKNTAKSAAAEAPTAEPSAAVADQNIAGEPNTDFPAKLTQLRSPIPPQLIKQRAGGTNRDNTRNQFDYVEWHTVADILDETAPNWTHSVKDIKQIGEIITVVVAITIDGITREGVGTGTASSETGIKKAEHDALKRAAVKFGVARELYRKENSDVADHVGRYSENDFKPDNPPENPQATGLQDLLTGRQRGAIRAIASDYKLDAEYECVKALHCEVEELNKTGASWFIDWLKHVAKGSETTSDNVVTMRRSEDTVTPETRANLLVQEGRVSSKNGAYIITDVIAGKDCTFTVHKDGEQILCGCGDFKTHAAKGEKDYKCAHKIAVEIFKAQST
jgi:hypothetical protein